MDIQTLLPQILPNAIAWTQFQSDYIARVGEGLPSHLIKVAERVGVAQPDRIRVAHVESLPLPEEPLLREAALHMGLLGPDTQGLTLGHSIYIVKGLPTVRLLSHEFRHVHQYEVLGGIAHFLPVYLDQIMAFGYRDAPLEIDARLHEIDAA